MHKVTLTLWLDGVAHLIGQRHWKFLPTASMFTICVITLFKLGVVYFSVPFTYWKSKIPRNTAHRHQSSAMRQAKQMNTAKTSSAEHTFDQQHH